MIASFTLPFPPSVNHYWRHINRGAAAGRVLLSSEGRDYRAAAYCEILRQKVPRNRLTGRLRVAISASPPDRRRRDLDNMLKALLDVLHHTAVIRDDSDVDDLHIVRGPVKPHGRVSISIDELTETTKESTHVDDPR